MTGFKELTVTQDRAGIHVLLCWSCQEMVKWLYIMLMEALSLPVDGKAYPVQNWSSLLDEGLNVFKKLKHV